MPIYTPGMQKFKKKVKLQEDQERLKDVLTLKERMQQTMESLIKEEKVKEYPTYLQMFQFHGTIDYDKSNLIGRGMFTKSFKLPELQGGELRAAKVIDMEKARAEYRDKFLPRQLNILVFLREHQQEYILQTFAICRVRHHMFIYSEYCSLGSMRNFFKIHKKKKPTPFTYENVKIHAYQLLQVIDFLHYYCIAHRNLTPDNIFMKDTINIKVSGFGFSRFCYDVESETFRKSASKREPDPFLAPEMIDGETSDPKLGDLWSWASLAYWMSTGLLPYEPDKMQKKNEKLTTYRYRLYQSERILNSGSQPMSKLLENVLIGDPKKRFTLAQIKSSPWAMELTEAAKKVLPKVDQPKPSEPAAVKSQASGPPSNQGPSPVATQASGPPSNQGPSPIATQASGPPSNQGPSPIATQAPTTKSTAEVKGSQAAEPPPQA